MKRGLNLNAEERSYLITAVVVACAIAARVISKEGIAADTMGLIRSVLYIGLYFVWGISIKKRVMQAQVQRYLTAIVGMMIFWFIVRTMKYFFVADIDAKRQLWYLYYFPMLFIPLLSFFVALSLGKTEKYRLPRRALLLCIPTVCLLLFVLTNDFHEWIFRFPEGQPRSDANGMYSIGFLFVAGWEIICAVAALVLFSSVIALVERSGLVYGSDNGLFSALMAGTSAVLLNESRGCACCIAAGIPVFSRVVGCFINMASVGYSSLEIGPEVLFSQLAALSMAIVIIWIPRAAPAGISSLQPLRLP